MTVSLAVMSLSGLGTDKGTPACVELVPMYAMTNEMDTEEFAHFTDETNLTAPDPACTLLDAELAPGFTCAGIVKWLCLVGKPPFSVGLRGR